MGFHSAETAWNRVVHEQDPPVTNPLDDCLHQCGYGHERQPLTGLSDAARED